MFHFSDYSCWRSLEERLVLLNNDHFEMEPEISLPWLTTLEAEIIQHLKGSSPHTWLHASLQNLLLCLDLLLPFFKSKKEGEGRNICSLALLLKPYNMPSCPVLVA